MHIVKIVSVLHTTSPTRTSSCTDKIEQAQRIGLNFGTLAKALLVSDALLLSSITSCWFGDNDSMYKHESVHGLSQPLPHTDKKAQQGGMVLG